MSSEIEHEPANRAKFSLWKVAIYASLVAGVIVIVSIMILLFFPDLYLNNYFKSRIVSEFSGIKPGYNIKMSGLHYNFFSNTIDCGSVDLSSKDADFLCTIDKLSLKGFGWLQVLFYGNLQHGSLTNSITQAQNIVLKSRKSQNEFLCSRLLISFHESKVIAENLVTRSLSDNDSLFEKSNFSRTRYNLVLPEVKVNGLFMRGKVCHLSFLQIRELLLDILVNKSEPSDSAKSKLTISDILISIKGIVSVDSLNILKGQVNYSSVNTEGSDLSAGDSGYKFRFSGLNVNLAEKHTELGDAVLISDDSTVTCSVSNSSLKGIDWLKKLEVKGTNFSDVLDGSVAEVQQIALKSSNEDYEVHCKHINLSLHDSELIAKDLEINPKLNDNQFFGESKFRKTRYSISLPLLKVNGFDFDGLLLGKKYNARFIEIREASLDVLVNMNKPYKRVATKTLMPNEMLAAIKEIIHLDSLRVINGQLKYGEIYQGSNKPAFITFNNMNLLAKGITNDNNRVDTAVIQGNAIFMRGGMMKMLMYIPLTAPKFSYRYSGSISLMELSKLNSFLEIGEHYRIKSGIVNFSSCDIHVKDGHATGNVRANYENLKLAILDSRTSSEKGIMNRLTSFFANTFKIKGTNIKDNSGILKLGKVNYTRKRDDTFTQVAWYALRSGISNIVGF